MQYAGRRHAPQSTAAEAQNDIRAGKKYWLLQGLAVRVAAGCRNITPKYAAMPQCYHTTVSLLHQQCQPEQILQR